MKYTPLFLFLPLFSMAQKPTDTVTVKLTVEQLTKLKHVLEVSHSALPGCATISALDATTAAKEIELVYPLLVGVKKKL